MTTAVITLAFGEPSDASPEVVEPYLERIFRANASLEDFADEEALRSRSRELARRRTPGLVAEYEEIGGSPLDEQARAQAAELEDELRARGRDAAVLVGMQFTEPFVGDAVEQARRTGADRVVGLPIYPLCGASTTVAALRELARAVAELEWDAEVAEVAGWHRHPGYLELRADAIASLVRTEGLDLDDPGTRLLFSAHGTPLRYLEEGNRYRAYVHDLCATMAAMLGVDDYGLGYQNHRNRDIPWTEPDVEDVVASTEADRLVVDPVSFMHEQSETLSELDVELREEAEARGIDFHRVPVPHDDERFPGVLADLVEAVLGEEEDGRRVELHRCRCRASPATHCLNGPAAE